MEIAATKLKKTKNRGIASYYLVKKMVQVSSLLWSGKLKNGPKKIQTNDQKNVFLIMRSKKDLVLAQYLCPTFMVEDAKNLKCKRGFSHDWIHRQKEYNFNIQWPRRPFYLKTRPTGQRCVLEHCSTFFPSLIYFTQIISTYFAFGHFDESVNDGLTD